MSIAFFFLLSAPLAAQEPSPISAADAASDFRHFWNDLAKHYCYSGKKRTDWNAVRRMYMPRTRAIKTRVELLHLAEDAIAELYDDHATMGADAPGSPRIVPSRTDLWGAWRDDIAVLEEVRPDSPAAKVGLRAGDEVLSVNGDPVGKAVAGSLPRTLTAPGPGARDWALRRVLAGRRGQRQRLELRRGTETLEVELPDGPSEQPDKPLESRTIAPGIGYIRLHNSLGNDAAVAAFDTALAALKDSRALLLDLRDTPGGGDNTVAEPIMGRFLSRRSAYQKFVIPHGRRFTQYVNPRGPFTYEGRIVVLVDHWTASMGEGMAVGMAGTGRAVVVGTAMAGLNGGIHDGKMPHSGIPYHFPAEQIYTVDGTPREHFRPSVLVDLIHSNDKVDPILACGLAVIEGATSCSQ